MGESILMGGGGRIPQLSEQVETFYLTVGVLSFTLIWTQPAQDQDESFIGTRIVRKVGSCPQSPNDGTVIYEGTAFTYTDTGLTEGTTYYYRAFAYNSHRKYQNSMRYVSATAAEYLMLSELPVAALVSIPYDGTDTNFIVINQGKPSDLYSDTCDGTWLLSQNIVGRYPDYNGYYYSSNFYNYLNTVAFELLSVECKQLVLNAKIPYHTDCNTTSRAVHTGEDGLPSTLFPLSLTEVGTVSRIDTCPLTRDKLDGTRLSYFLDGDSTEACELRKLPNATSTRSDTWRLRDTLTNNVNVIITEQGKAGGELAEIEDGIRPAMILRSSGLVYPNPNESGAYELVEGQI